MVSIVVAISLSACSQKNNAHDVVYNTSVDVPLYNWTSTDTLFYPLIIEEEPNVKHPIQLHRDYHLRVSMRHSIGYPLSKVPAHFCLQQTDTINGSEQITRRVMQIFISPEVRDSEGRPLGTGWGSLYEHQEELPDITVRFDQPGSYRFLIIPAFKGAPEGIDGMASMGLEIYE